MDSLEFAESIDHPGKKYIVCRLIDTVNIMGKDGIKVYNVNTSNIFRHFNNEL